MPPTLDARLVDHRDRKYLTAEERTRFPTVQTLARMLALTGCRVSEALGIRACDVDLAAVELRIATLKRRRPHWRAVPIPEDLAQALELVHRVRRAQASVRGRTRGLCCKPDVGVSRSRAPTVLASCFGAGQMVL